MLSLDVGGSEEIEEARRERRVVAAVGGEEEGDAGRLIDRQPGGIEAGAHRLRPLEVARRKDEVALPELARGEPDGAGEIALAGRAGDRRQRRLEPRRRLGVERPPDPSGEERRSFARRRCRGGRHPAQVPGTIRWASRVAA